MNLHILLPYLIRDIAGFGKCLVTSYIQNPLTGAELPKNPLMFCLFPEKIYEILNPTVKGCFSTCVLIFVLFVSNPFGWGEPLVTY